MTFFLAPVTAQSAVFALVIAILVVKAHVDLTWGDIR